METAESGVFFEEWVFFSRGAGGPPVAKRQAIGGRWWRVPRRWCPLFEGGGRWATVAECEMRNAEMVHDR
jgi:hypothetical protein